MKVIFTFQKIDGCNIDVIYKPFDNEHSLEWYKLIKDFCDSGQKIIEHDRVYNFINSDTDVNKAVDRCNSLINQINTYISPVVIPLIPHNNIQHMANLIHVNFVHSNQEINYTKNCDDRLWSELNAQLHGIEILLNNEKETNPSATVFVELFQHNYWHFNDDTYNHFTTLKNYGYAYSVNAHVGRHLYEMYMAQDNNLEKDHIVLMNKLSGSSFLWFGKSTGLEYNQKRLDNVQAWYYNNKLNEILNMEWGDPRLTIGDLPVGEISNGITREDMEGVVILESINVE
jgi:hypothetical protein